MFIMDGSSRANLWSWLAIVSVALNVVMLLNVITRPGSATDQDITDSLVQHHSLGSSSSHRRDLKASVQLQNPASYDVFRAIKEGRVMIGGHTPRGFLYTPHSRDQLGNLLEAMGGFTVGAEVGVQSGSFSRTILDNWPSCKRFYLIDLWAHQENYTDHANVNDNRHMEYYHQAQKNMEPYKEKAVFLRNCSTCAAPLIPDLLDFVYIDARHDYCGVSEDLQAYWEKLRPGGIMAGHDYNDAAFVANAGQDWELCQNGTRHHGAVLAAVLQFALRHAAQVSRMPSAYGDSWMMLKPYRRSPDMHPS